MARVLVIGGTLFIGKALVERLLDRGDDVTILHRGRHNPFAGRTAELHADRNDGAAVADLIRGRGFELVFDNVYDWQRGTTAAPVEQAARACGDSASAGSLSRYVFMSSVAAYGSGESVSEDAPLAAPDDPDAYCRNKADTERMLFRLNQEEGLPAVTLRPPYIYGPENPFYREQFFFDRILAGRPVIVPGDGSREMQFVLVDDLVEAAIRASELETAVGRAYNVAQEFAVTQDQLVDAVAEACERPVEKIHVGREKLLSLGGQVFEPPYYFAQYYDMPPITQKIDRARADLGLEPTPFVEGLRRSLAWYKSQERPEPDFSFDEKVLTS